MRDMRVQAAPSCLGFLHRCGGAAFWRTTPERNLAGVGRGRGARRRTFVGRARRLGLGILITVAAQETGQTGVLT